MKTQNEIREYLENLSDGDLLSLWNEYRSINHYDGDIFDMEEFNEICGNMEPSDLANRIFYGRFNPNDDYFVFDGYENLKSSNYLYDFVDIYGLAQFIYDNDDDLDSDDLRDFLDEDEEDDEEDGEEDGEE